MDTEQKTQITDFEIPVKKTEIHPEGEHEAKITKIFLETDVETRFGVQDRIRICFQTEHGNIFGFIPAKIGQNNRTKRWLEAILKKPVENSVKSSEILGKQCKILVKHIQGVNGTYAIVAGVYPA